MIYFYYGEDSFRAKETVSQLRDKFIKLYDPSGSNIEHIDADTFTLENFFTKVKASGFLSPKKFIVIRNIFSIKKFADIQDLIIEFLKKLKNTTDENYLVFWQEDVPRKNLKLYTTLIKLCTPNKCCKEFELLDTPHLIAWLQQTARKRSKILSKDAAELCIMLVGTSTWALYHELEKVCSFAAAETITIKDIEDIATSNTSETLFPLVDAIGLKDTKKALELLDRALQTETDQQFILAMINRQFRMIALAKDANNKTNNTFAISQMVGAPPFVIKKLLPQSSRYNKSDIIRVYRELIVLDRIAKSDPESLKTALTLFIMNL